MHEPLIAWSRLLLRLGLVLLAIGTLPALAVQYIFTGFDPLIAVFLLFSVAPLGAIVLFAAIILFLVALVRRKPGAPS